MSDAAAPTSLSRETTSPDASARAWDLALRIIDLARGQIVATNPFLSTSVDLLRPAPAALELPFACTGQTVYVDADRLVGSFARSREVPVHDLAHVLLHCLLLHPFIGATVDVRAWNLAADIVVEGLAGELVGPRPGARGQQIAATIKQLSRDFEGQLTTERLYRSLREGAYADRRRGWETLFCVDDHSLWSSSAAGAAGPATSAQDGPDAPQQTSDQQASGMSAQTKGSLTQADASAVAQDANAQPKDAAESSKAAGNSSKASPHGSGSEGPEGAAGQTDTAGAGSDAASHDDAPAPSGTQTPEPASPTQLRQAEEAWRHAAKSMRVDLETLSRTRGSGLGGLVRELEVSSHERVDYREFLRQFAVEHEDMRLSEDEFDYVFYTYGLELYHDMPLIEPLEYRSDKRIRDFAIVIDTSSSVSEKVVQEFVNTTFDVLSSEGGFFAQTNIHIIQADARVQSDAKITSLADLDRWRRTIKLYGFGGTDFRPAFRYVQQLRQSGEFEDLQGLIYFTDGWGIYPDRMPPYKCAFVFYDEDHRPELVPPWAIQVVLHPGEFESLSVY